MAAAKRGTGPRKKAVEVAEADWADHRLLQTSPRKGYKVLLPAHLFACGVHWMMREIELADLKSSNIKFDATNRLVTITLQHFKMDTEGRGISRTLQCICDEGCDLRCPRTVLEMLVNNATLKGAKDGHLAFREGGSGASKAEIVGDWRKLYGKEVTGHSTRRSGALREELDALKVHSQGANNALADANSASKYPPPLVRSTRRHQVVHKNCKTLVFFAHRPLGRPSAAGTIIWQTTSLRRGTRQWSLAQNARGLRTARRWRRQTMAMVMTLEGAALDA